MNIAIVNCFDTYEERIDLVNEYFVSKGHKVTVIQSNFRHIKKKFRNEEKQNYLFVSSEAYYKNLSISRMKSHYLFAKKAFEFVGKIKPDMLYAVVPPNSIAKFATDYKKKNPDVKLVFDLIDLWPETMPVGRLIKIVPPFSSWGYMRDNSLQFANAVVTECNLYQNILKDTLKGIKTETVYLAKREINVDYAPKLSEDQIHLCYLGSINNIIDIPKIREIIKLIHEIKKVTLHVIGDGESKDEFLKEILSTGANVNFHGEIYDPQEKQNIFNGCHFGLNIMKASVCVGLTMKSIDYFQYGLPIINNINADTTEILEKFNVGINITNQNIEKAVDRIVQMNKSEFMSMRICSQKLFSDLFSIKAFENQMEKVFSTLF